MNERSNAMKKNKTSRGHTLIIANILIFSLVAISFFIYPKGDEDNQTHNKTQDDSTQQLNEIKNNSNLYPDELLDLAEKNPETADFVLNYPSHKDYLDNDLSSLDLSNVPKLYQWDKRWGYTMYGDNLHAITGCAPTVLSMAALYLSKNSKYTPHYFAQFSEKYGYYINSVGTDWGFITDGAHTVGLQASEIPNMQHSIDNILENDGLVICSMRPGDFTSTGHFILIAGISSNGEYIIHDPNSEERSNKTWSYETLQHQISGIWSITN